MIIPSLLIVFHIILNLSNRRPADSALPCSRLLFPYITKTLFGTENSINNEFSCKTNNLQVKFYFI